MEILDQAGNPRRGTVGVAKSNWYYVRIWGYPKIAADWEGVPPSGARGIPPSLTRWK